MIATFRTSVRQQLGDGHAGLHPVGELILLNVTILMIEAVLLKAL